MRKWFKAIFQRSRSNAVVGKPSTAKQDNSSVLELAQRLAKPCIWLQREGDLLAAVWNDTSFVAGPSVYRHCISIDCTILPKELGLPSGVLTLYSDAKLAGNNQLSHDPNATLLVGSGTPLYACSSISLPPPAAAPELDCSNYLKVWTENCPLYRQDVVAVLGGWHFPWPDDDWDDFCNKNLIVWTIENSEPWIEVWKDEQKFVVMERVT